MILKPTDTENMTEFMKNGIQKGFIGSIFMLPVLSEFLAWIYLSLSLRSSKWFKTTMIGLSFFSGVSIVILAANYTNEAHLLTVTSFTICFLLALFFTNTVAISLIVLLSPSRFSSRIANQIYWDMRAVAQAERKIDDGTRLDLTVKKLCNAET